MNIAAQQKKVAALRKKVASALKAANLIEDQNKAAAPEDEFANERFMWLTTITGRLYETMDKIQALQDEIEAQLLEAA